MFQHERVVVPGRRLGRKPNAPEKRLQALALDDYLPALPPAPASLDLTTGIASFPVYANDVKGDCTCAAAGHMLEVWTRQVTGTPRLLQDSDVLALYDLVNGGIDAGASEMDVLDAWRHTGLAGDKLFAYAAVTPSDHQLVETACWLFSGLYLGIALPLSAQHQDVWNTVSRDIQGDSTPGSWGGHAVDVVGYDPGGLTVVTWGATKRMTWAFWDEYVDEAWALIPSDYQQLGSKPLENGFDLAQLEQDLAEVGKH